jgi:hypothetical protein
MTAAPGVKAGSFIVLVPGVSGWPGRTLSIQQAISVSGGGVVMAFTQSRCQIGVLRGPKGRQAPLNGSTMAGAEVKGRQLIAGPLSRDGFSHR